MKSILNSTGTLMSIITSTGLMGVLSVDAIAQLNALEACTLVIQNIKIQPRLVSVAAVISKYFTYVY